MSWGGPEIFWRIFRTCVLFVGRAVNQMTIFLSIVVSLMVRGAVFLQKVLSLGAVQGRWWVGLRFGGWFHFFSSGAILWSLIFQEALSYIHQALKYAIPRFFFHEKATHSCPRTIDLFTAWCCNKFQQLSMKIQPTATLFGCWCLDRVMTWAPYLQDENTKN